MINTTKEVLSNFKKLMLSEGNISELSDETLSQANKGSYDKSYNYGNDYSGDVYDEEDDGTLYRGPSEKEKDLMKKGQRQHVLFGDKLVKKFIGKKLFNKTITNIKVADKPDKGDKNSAVLFYVDNKSGDNFILKIGGGGDSNILVNLKEYPNLKITNADKKLIEDVLSTASPDLEKVVDLDYIDDILSTGKHPYWVKHKSLDEVLDALISGDIKPQEQPEEGTSISLAQLEDICKNVEFIKSQIGEGDIVPDWALQHISVAADNIHEVVVFFEGEEESESPEEQADEDIHMIGESGKKKPSAGLSKKEKSAIVKKAEKGEDIGRKGKSFEKIAKKAGGGEKGDKIAGSIMWKQQSKKAK